MKRAIPGIQCDDDNNDDAPAADDDAAADDDTTPDDYWKCLKGYSDKDSCTSNDCEWCTNKAGYGICMSKEAAEKIDHYHWFDCTAEVDMLFTEDAVVEDPYDPSCLQASLEGDRATCEATTDADGSPCEWCNVASANLCLTGDQAAIVQQFGGDCSASIVDDPYDPSCLMATLSGDEATCESTVDSDGNGCEWCLVNSVELCLNAEQAEIAEQIGGECSNTIVMVEQDDKENDPYDSTCLQATVHADEAICEATKDMDGNPCEWCTVSGVFLCVNTEQAQAAELLGGQCSSGNFVADPYDTSCLQAALQGDESTCAAAVDEDGNPCEWCSIAGMNLCLTDEQADAAAIVGGECKSADEYSL